MSSFKGRILIGCSGAKRPGVLPAWQKYDGPLWKSLRTIDGVEHLINNNKIFVVSAQHGVFSAAQSIDDYDHCLTNRGSILSLADLIKTQDIPQGGYLVFAGKKYRQA